MVGNVVHHRMFPVLVHMNLGWRWICFLGEGLLRSVGCLVFARIILVEVRVGQDGLLIFLDHQRTGLRGRLVGDPGPEAGRIGLVGHDLYPAVRQLDLVLACGQLTGGVLAMAVVVTCRSSLL